MWLSDVSVKRPVLATVISMLLVAFGLLAFRELPTREYPDIVPPVISVTTGYPGASAEVVETRITQLLEGEISGLEGIKTITSRSQDERSSISIEFELDRDIDQAANDVRDRVSRVAGRLPEGVDLPSIQKQDSDARPVMYMNLLSDSMNPMELTDYAERYIVDRLAVIPGVSQIGVYGSGRPSMRIAVDRRALAARELTVADIETALRRENIELPAGRLEASAREFPIRIDRNYRTAEDFRRLVVARGEDGHLIRLGEVAEVAVGPRDLRSEFRTNGRNTVAFGVVKQSNANTVEVLEAVKETVARINAELPESMSLLASTDDSVFIRAAIRAVYWTIGITTLLVSAVILIFLGSLRAMAIPAVTIPICLIASFIALAAFGFSINLITLLAMVLSIGLIVDDAIVVLENIHRRIEKGEPPLLAAYRGTRQVGFAVISTTVVLVAVFAPIVFLKDNIGLIFSELAVTISAAVIFSTLLALSLTPMMCSKLLKPESRETRATRAIDRFFRALAARYERALEGSIRRPWVSALAALAIAAGAAWLYQNIDREYAPGEDQGAFLARAQAAEGTSFERMVELVNALEAPLLPMVESGDVERALIRAPSFGNPSPNTAFIVVNLPPEESRGLETEQVIRRVNAAWAEIPGVRAFAFSRSGISRGQGGQPVQFVLGGSTYGELARWRDLLIADLEQNPNFRRVDSDLKETQPQLYVRIDKDRAADLGVSVQAIGQTLEAMMGEKRVTTYVVDGEEYDVLLQALAGQRETRDDLRNIYVRSGTSGELVSLANLTRMETRAGPASLNRYNRLRAVTVSADVAEGYSLGEALDYMEGFVRRNLPATAQIDYKGESLEYKEASGGIFFTLGIALLVVFLVLAAQFESFVHPFVIMTAVPLAVAGALLGIQLTGGTFSIYSQIGIIILVGIATKNGILLVEFINQLRDAGSEFGEAIVHGAGIRLRPVLMTTVSTVMGSVPLLLATGAGSVGRNALGVVMFFGVAVSAVLTLFVVPSFYALLARGTGSRRDVELELEALGRAAREGA